MAAMPMLTGTLITAVGFLPIGLAQSTVGEYTFAIFAVTAAALVISWCVSVHFVPYLGTLFLHERIMRNSVILIDQIDQIEHDRSRGRDAWTSIVEAAVRRFRPIMLTAAAAVLAMIPLSRNVFGGPMAVAIMGGLIVATGLTLLSLPAMYAAWFRVRREPVN